MTGGAGAYTSAPRAALLWQVETAETAEEAETAETAKTAEAAETAKTAEAAETAGWSRRNLPSDFFPRRSSWG